MWTLTVGRQCSRGSFRRAIQDIFHSGFIKFFFPYILLLVAILLYLPWLFWRFTAAPHLFSDLKFVMEELDRAYNRAIKAAHSCHNGDSREHTSPLPVMNENTGQSLWEISESYFKYPMVEQYLKTKKRSKGLIIKYITCRLLTLTIIVLVCLYLGYYISLSSLTDEFICNLKTGILKNDTTVPERIQCKLIAVGIFQLLSYINLIVYLLLIPVVLYALLVPIRQSSDILQLYEILPTFDVLEVRIKRYDDLSLYLLFLEENISELKSYKCLKVLESLKGSGEKFDAMQLLMNLGMIKTDTIDGKPTVVKDNSEKKVEGNTANSAAELKDLSQPTSTGDGATTSKADGKVRQRLLDSSC
ncbi:pannexin-1 isoform X2 [Eublepharis macularius]|uniref:Pannexin-1 isoform X2 n=1 Tax=Eublepharis macularius TaxID=481883 RepID=A0AA97J468_EUBMA|nr:pannexin-1 isoform X2 [Eublepharis macularius]